MLFIYWACCFCLIILAAEQGVEAAYQISAKPSDTLLYFRAFNTSFDDISNYLFYHYPLFLKWVIAPSDSVYFALIGQCAALSASCLWVLRRSANVFYILVLLNHTVIYTCTNLFKDNYLIIIMFFTVGLLIRLKKRWVKSLVVMLSIWGMTYIRPFSFLYAPLIALPYMFANDNKLVARAFWFIALAGLLTILVWKWGLIVYIASHWSSDASVGTGGLSIASLPKIILGPTPFHYFYHDSHFIQPFLDGHGAVLLLLHYVYYFALSWFVVLCFSHFSIVASSLFSCHGGIYSLGIGLATLLVYLIAYGTADIRQRAVILALIFTGIALTSARNSEVWERSLTRTQSIWVGSLFLMFYVISMAAI